MAISFVGFFDAVYLTIQHYQNGIPPCYGFQGCDLVLTSRYSTVRGVPISLIGAIYYLAIFISGIWFIDSKNSKALSVLAYLPMGGFAVSLLLLYLQVFVIKAVCDYCVISAASSTVLFILGLKVLKFKNRINL